MHEPSLSFNQAALKIQWSQELINNLNSVCNSFINSKPYAISDELNSESGMYEFKIGLTRKIPVVVPLLMGDICGNLRASLDYAWMGVIQSECGSNAGKDTLPIADNGKGLVSTISKTSIKASVKEIEILLLDRIKLHRDFKSGGNRGIIALNDLSNWQKHNLLIVTAGVTRVPTIYVGTNRIDQVTVEGGICSLFHYSPEYRDLRYEGEPTIKILFGGRNLVQNQPIVPTLANLTQATTEAIEAFCDVFPSASNPRFGT
jgi:hypothetical protein